MRVLQFYFLDGTSTEYRTKLNHTVVKDGEFLKVSCSLNAARPNRLARVLDDGSFLTFGNLSILMLR